MAGTFIEKRKKENNFTINLKMFLPPMLLKTRLQVIGAG